VGYSFRYQPVLNYRERRKEQAEIALAKARERLGEARRLLEEYRRKLYETTRDFESRLKTGMSADEIQNHREYLETLGRRIESQEEEVFRLEKVVRRKMHEVLQRSREYRIMEKLRDKDFDAWRRKQFQEEQKWMNEVAVTRHGREFP